MQESTQPSDANNAAQSTISGGSGTHEHRKNDDSSVQKKLSGRQFKQLWTTLPTGGNFDCKLRSQPDAKKFGDHLRSSGKRVLNF